MAYNSQNANGQATSANSSPVVIASDQSAVPVSQTDTLGTGTITVTDALGGVPGGTGVLISTAPTASSFVAMAVPGGGSQGDIQILGTATGTYYFENSMDSTNGSDGNWIAVNYRQTGIVNTVLGFSFTTNGVFRGNISGFKYVRVRNVGGTTPNNAITIRITNGTGTMFQNASTPSGTNVIGKFGIDQTTPGTTNLVALAANQSVNSAQVNGVAVSTGTGIMGTGTQRVTISSDNDPLSVKQTTAANLNATVVGTGTFAVQSAATLQAGSAIAGKFGIDQTTPGTTNLVALAANQSINTAQINGVATATGTGIMGTGVQRIAIASDNDALTVKQATAANLNATVVGTGTFAVQAASTLATETTKVIGVVRTSDGAGNLLTSNSTTYTAKFGLDGNLLGTLGTAFSTAGKVDVKGADGDVFVRQATGTNLHTVVDSGTITTVSTVTAVTAITNALPAGTNLMGKVGIDQTTVGTTNAVSLAQIGATTIATGNGVVSAGVTRVAIASDNTAFAVNATLSAETTKVIGTVNIAASQTISAVTSITNALPVGANVIGKTSIDQTTPGTTNLVALTAETTKVIGVVAVKGLSSATQTTNFAAAATGNTTGLDVSAAGNVTFVIKNTVAANAFGTGGVVVFEQSDDNTSWAPLNVTRSTDGVSGNTFALGANTASASIMFDAGMQGVNFVRVRVTTAVITNSMTIFVQPGGMPFVPSVSIINGQVRPSYKAASIALLVPAVTVTVPWFVIYGSSTKTVKVQRIIVSGVTLTAVAYLQINCTKYSTAPTGGTATTFTSVPLDSRLPAASASLVQGYTAIPTAGTVVGTLDSRRVLGQATTPAAAGVLAPDLIFDFRMSGNSEMGQSLLRGTAEGIGLNWGIAPASTPSLTVTVEFTEE